MSNVYFIDDAARVVRETKRAMVQDGRLRRVVDFDRNRVWRIHQDEIAALVGRRLGSKKIERIGLVPALAQPGVWELNPSLDPGDMLMRLIALRTPSSMGVA